MQECHIAIFGQRMVRIRGKVGAERRSARRGCHSACGSRARGGGGRGGGDCARGGERHFEARMTTAVVVLSSSSSSSSVRATARSWRARTRARYARGRVGARAMAGGDDDDDDDVLTASARAPSPTSSSYAPPSRANELAPISPRRVVVGTLGATALALGANFLRVTEKLLGAVPEFARANKLDVVYPVQGFLRSYEPQKGYTFIYPVDYLADQTMARRKAMRVEERNSLDPPSLRRESRRDVQEPDAAYGPMNSTGEENVSVIVSSVPAGFDLSVFGDAQSQANWLLANVLAKPGSGKTGTLINSSSKVVSGAKYYTFEYTIQKGEPGASGSWFRHNVAVFVTRGSALFTLVAQIPEEKWTSRRNDFFKIADSFRVFVPSG